MEKKLAAGLSIISNATIIILKLIAGIISGSISIISEAIHSLSDLLASVLTFFAVIRSSEPADQDHPFGHGKYEDMSGFIEGSLIIIAGIYIICQAANKMLFGYDFDTESYWGIGVMAFAVVANFLISQYLFAIAKKTDSIALYADGQHLRTDIYSSLGVLVGLIIIKLTGWVVLDSVIAIIVAAIIIKAGLSITKDTLNNLLDGSLPPEDIFKIERIIKAHKGIKGYKNLKARKAGQCRDIEVTLFFDPDMTIADCHQICDEIENSISQSLSNISMAIHLEPMPVEELIPGI